MIRLKVTMRRTVDASISTPPCGRRQKGWHSRGYLPHLDAPDLIQSVTLRLADAVPTAVLTRWQEDLCRLDGAPATGQQAIELRRRIAAYEDAGYGECWLRDERVAATVEDALLHFDGERYALIAWCVMPNHVHAVIEPRHGFGLGSVMHSWKSFTAKHANQTLGREGAFWAPDYFDRYIRNDTHLAAAVRYIEQNPVTAGLVTRAETWGFSSLRRRFPD